MKLDPSSYSRLTRRLAADAGEAGFTLIELLIVIIIIGILLAIAVPSYLGFKDRASKMAAQANVRAAIPAVETYFADHNHYLTMDEAALLTYDAGLKVSVGTATATGYCIYNTIGNWTYHKSGPAGSITAGGC